ncbi:hypothetical protein [Ureibacillus sp. GCM10028918]|uniref:hypothetical protein n=1 Tax=Ureibacillus sp. GCM10028918 TaxID=3273429 RepID=UPI003616D0D1
MIKKRIFSTTLIICIGLAACNGEDTATNEEEITEPSPTDEASEPAAEDTPTEENASEEIEPDNWARKIYEIASNEEVASDKFYELEQYLLEYEASEEEVDQFKTDIVEDYQSGTYLDEIDNHDRMLTNIFKSYFVEKNNEGAIKEFAFDYNQNLKYAYRGVDSPDSDAVKSNEAQMDKVLAEIE